MGSWENYFGLVDQQGIIIKILSLRVSTSESRNIDHQSKETCAIISTQVTLMPILSFLCVIQERQLY